MIYQSLSLSLSLSLTHSISLSFFLSFSFSLTHSIYLSLSLSLSRSLLRFLVNPHKTTDPLSVSHSALMTSKETSKVQQPNKKSCVRSCLHHYNRFILQKSTVKAFMKQFWALLRLSIIPVVAAFEPTTTK